MGGTGDWRMEGLVSIIHFVWRVTYDLQLGQLLLWFTASHQISDTGCKIYIYLFTWEVEAEDKLSSDIYYFCEAHLTQVRRKLWMCFNPVTECVRGYETRVGRGLVMIMA